MTTYERELYDVYVMDSMKGRDYLISAEARGKDEGRAEGEIEKATTIAKAMLADGDSVEKIARITGLSVTEVKKLNST